MKHTPLLTFLGLLVSASIASGQESDRRETSSPGLLKLWSRDDLDRGRIVGLSHDQKTLLTRTGKYELLHMATGRPLAKQPPIGSGEWLAFVPGRSHCVYVNQSKDFIRLWDISRGEWLGDPILAYTDSPGGDGGVTWPRFSPHGEFMVTEPESEQLQFWDLHDGKPRAITQPFENGGPVWEYRVDDQWVYTTSPSESRVWDLRSGKLQAGPFPHGPFGIGHPSSQAPLYSKQRQLLVTFENPADGDDLNASELVLRSSADESWKVVRRIKVPGQIRRLNWLGADHLLVQGKQKGELWGRGYQANVVFVVSLAAGDDSAGSSTVRVLPRTAFDLAVAPDGKHWITATDKSVICWRLGWKEPLWERSYPRSHDWRRNITISEHQQVLVHEWVGPAFVWDLTTGTEIWRSDANIVFANLKHPYVMISHVDRGVEVWRAERLEKYFGDGKLAGEAREFGMKPRLNFRWCPPGKFMMGSPDTEKGRSESENQVEVTLSKGFWMTETEVTQGTWTTAITYHSELRAPWTDKWPQPIRESDTRFPVVFLTRRVASEFCKKYTAIERSAGRLPKNWCYRLPTEAEWQYACRAGTTTAWSMPDASHLGYHAWYAENTKNTPHVQRVRQKAPNNWGLYDMHGNVHEWVSDRASHSLTAGIAPRRPANKDAIGMYVGGAWNSPATELRSSFRKAAPHDGQFPTVGFRMVLSPVDD